MTLLLVADLFQITTSQGNSIASLILNFKKYLIYTAYRRPLSLLSEREVHVSRWRHEISRQIGRKQEGDAWVLGGCTLHIPNVSALQRRNNV